MITYEDGDLFDVVADAYVNPVNCVGAAGKGLALQFKEKFPTNFLAYKHACDKKEVVPGKIFVKKHSDIATPYFILNFPTKRHYKDKSLIEDIDAGMEELVKLVNLLELRSIAIPALGCGEGGLEWKEVWAVITKHVWQVSLMNINFILVLPKRDKNGTDG